MRSVVAGGRRDYDLAIPATASQRPKIRDADRSREAILDAAERLFAARGFDGVSLTEIGAASGLSRATPSYFFGSKERLYAAVLERVFAERQEQTANAVAPVLAWCERGGDLRDLRTALARGMDGYMRFLLRRPAFARFITWEELAGGRRLRATPRNSTALTDTFAALGRVGRKRGLRPFKVGDAVLLWVSLTYAPLANRHTLLVALDRDLSDARTRRRHVDFAVDQVMFLLAGGRGLMEAPG
jgi:TetR/AcrR family transcriptional regulator